MPSPLLRRQGCVLLPPRLFPEIGYYALMASYPEAVIDVTMRYDKRAKAVHRYRIADTRGPLELTVPVVRPEGATSAAGVPWAAVGVSAHGRWWEVHRTALESAYGRTPFFEFYIDRLAPLFAPRPLPGDACETVGDLVLRADAAVRAILGISTRVSAILTVPAPSADFRRLLPAFDYRPYWQLRADRLGYLPGMSILDLIFNLGPEAPLYLQNTDI